VATVRLVVCLLLLVPATAWAEWQFKPFIGTTLDGQSTYVLTEEAATERHLVVGGGALWLGNVLGVEGEISRVPGFFQSEGSFALSGGLTTLLGSVVVAAPRRFTEYSLRPYLTAGGGWVRVGMSQQEDQFNVNRTLTAVAFGGGATGFLNDRIGLNWDLRYLRTVGGEDDTGLTIGTERVSYWRASMGVAIRVGTVR
jgi:Outer membrane protein beta-barrel domain